MDPGGGGAALSGAFHAEVVAPIMQRMYPGLRYAAARLGSGSDVLDLDDVMSRDHDWGCRLTLLLDEAEHALVPKIRATLESELPESFRGFPVRFPTTWDLTDTHKVEIATVDRFVASRLGCDPSGGLTVADWLSLTGHGVLEVIGGPIFVDRTESLVPIRESLAWYPPDIERYVLACGWQRLGQHLPLLGRTAERGDDLGSRLIAARLSRDLIRLAFLLHRRWPPYDKWLGTLFADLPASAAIAAHLDTAVTASGWHERQAAIGAAAALLLEVQRAAGLPAPAQAIKQFWDRPYLTIDEAVPAMLLADVSDPEVARLPAGLGSIEQWIDNTELLARPERRAATGAVYRSIASGPRPAEGGQSASLP